MTRADPVASQIRGHSGDEIDVLWSHLERRRASLLSEREAKRLLAVYGVSTSPGTNTIVAFLGTQEPLVVVPNPYTLCDYGDVPGPVRKSLHLSQVKSGAALRRIMPSADEDVIKALEKREPAHLRWLQYDPTFEGADAWQFKFLVSEVSPGFEIFFIAFFPGIFAPALARANALSVG